MVVSSMLVGVIMRVVRSMGVVVMPKRFRSIEKLVSDDRSVGHREYLIVPGAPEVLREGRPVVGYRCNFHGE